MSELFESTAEFRYSLADSGVGGDPRFLCEWIYGKSLEPANYMLYRDYDYSFIQQRGNGNGAGGCSYLAGQSGDGPYGRTI